MFDLNIYTESYFSGKSFVDMKEDLKRVCAPYCRNHDDAIALLEKVHITLVLLISLCFYLLFI